MEAATVFEKSSLSPRSNNTFYRVKNGPKQFLDAVCIHFLQD